MCTKPVRYCDSAIRRQPPRSRFCGPGSSSERQAGCYIPAWPKNITLKEIADMLAHVMKHMATKDDIADLRTELKGDIARVQDQVNSIETELKYGRYEKRLGNLEEKLYRQLTHLLISGRANAVAQ